jgi:hypothetical protein
MFHDRCSLYFVSVMITTDTSLFVTTTRSKGRRRGRAPAGGQTGRRGRSQDGRTGRLESAPGGGIGVAGLSRRERRPGRKKLALAEQNSARASLMSRSPVFIILWVPQIDDRMPVIWDDAPGAQIRGVSHGSRRAPTWRRRLALRPAPSRGLRPAPSRRLEAGRARRLGPAPARRLRPARRRRRQRPGRAPEGRSGSPNAAR